MKILHLEDNPSDAELVADRLRMEWPDCLIAVVSTEPEFVAALKQHTHDIILSDFQLPGFSGLDALALARKEVPDTPFIFLSGTVGEDIAVQLVLGGAADYLLKDRIHRLPIAMRRALRDNEERERHRQDAERIREQAELLNQARDGIIVTDLEDRIVFWNQGAERMLGWTAAEALGQIGAEHLGIALGTEIRAMDQKVTTTEEWRGEIQLCHKQGRPLVADARVSLVRDSAGRPKSRLKILTDITEKKNLEEQALRTQRLENLGMLGAGIAHDFNNALAPILMAGPLLRMHVSDPGGLRMLDMVEKCSARGAALVRQLLSFGGGAAGESQLLQVRHVLREVIDLAKITFSKSIQVESHLPTELWPVQGNPTQIHQVFLNLCVNARDAMPEGGELTLTATNQTLDAAAAARIADARPGAFLTVEVRDTGTGIPPEVLERIWEPFFTTKGEGKGTGLGLSTVRGILHRHGGFISVQTRVGHGTAFTVYLPAAEGAVDSERNGGSAQPKRGEGELILVVDDEEAVRELTATILTDHGYRAITACDGADAIAVFMPQAEDVRLLLTDLQMPMLNGSALAIALRRLNPSLPVVAMSGVGSPESAGYKELAKTFLAKPFQPATLLSVVRQTLDASRPPSPAAN